MNSLTRVQREFLVFVLESPDEVLPYQDPCDAGFSTATATEMTHRGFVHRTHRGFELTATGRALVRPGQPPPRQGGASHHYSRA